MIANISEEDIQKLRNLNEKLKQEVELKGSEESVENYIEGKTNERNDRKYRKQHT